MVLVVVVALASCAQSTKEPPTTTEQPTQTSEPQEEITTKRSYGFEFKPDDPPGPGDNWIAVQMKKEDKASFLSLFGVTEETVPFYEYYNDDGNLQLELYYDIEKKEGVGIYHGTGLNKHIGLEGFRIGAAEKAVWKDHKFSLATETYDTNDASDLPEYKEHKTYNEQGQITRFYSEARWDNYWDEADKIQKVSEIIWSYRKNGTLWKKVCSFSSLYYGTARGYETYYYNAKEHLVYTNAYLTAGGIEGYYIYEGSNEKPAYRLTVIHALGPACAENFVKY